MGQGPFSALRLSGCGGREQGSGSQGRLLDAVSALPGAVLRSPCGCGDLAATGTLCRGKLFPGRCLGADGGRPGWRRAWVSGALLGSASGLAGQLTCTETGRAGYDRDHFQRLRGAGSGRSAGARCSCLPMTGIAMRAVSCGESLAAGEGCGRRRLGWRTWRSWRGTATCRGEDAGQGDCSPHVRGWTRHDVRRPDPGSLLPARAGVDPRRASRRSSAPTVPRSCGGGPGEKMAAIFTKGCSPHAAGVSLPGSSAPTTRSPSPCPPLSPQSHARSPAMRRSHVLDRPKHRPGRKRRTGRHRRGLLRNGLGAFTAPSCRP